jgi:hypothetical protein
MRINAKEAGFYKKDLFRTNYDKIQIISVEELIEGRNVNIPSSVQTTFKAAGEKEEIYEHPSLFKNE